MFLMVWVLSPKETLCIIGSFSYLSEPRCSVPLSSCSEHAWLQELGSFWKSPLKIKREKPHLGTDEEKSFSWDGLICFTELRFSVTPF